MQRKKGIPQLVDAGIISGQTPAADGLLTPTLDLSPTTGLTREGALLGGPRRAGTGDGIFDLDIGAAAAVAVAAAAAATIVVGGARGSPGCR